MVELKEKSIYSGEKHPDIMNRDDIVREAEELQNKPSESELAQRASEEELLREGVFPDTRKQDETQWLMDRQKAPASKNENQEQPTDFNEEIDALFAQFIDAPSRTFSISRENYQKFMAETLRHANIVHNGMVKLKRKAEKLQEGERLDDLAHSSYKGLMAAAKKINDDFSNKLDALKATIFNIDGKVDERVVNMAGEIENWIESSEIFSMIRETLTNTFRLSGEISEKDESLYIISKEKRPQRSKRKYLPSETQPFIRIPKTEQSSPSSLEELGQAIYKINNIIAEAQDIDADMRSTEAELLEIKSDVPEPLQSENAEIQRLYGEREELYNRAFILRKTMNGIFSALQTEIDKPANPLHDHAVELLRLMEENGIQKKAETIFREVLGEHMGAIHKIRVQEGIETATSEEKAENEKTNDQKNTVSIKDAPVIQEGTPTVDLAPVDHQVKLPEIKDNTDTIMDLMQKAKEQVDIFNKGIDRETLAEDKYGSALVELEKYVEKIIALGYEPVMLIDSIKKLTEKMKVAGHREDSKKYSEPEPERLVGKIDSATKKIEGDDKISQILDHIEKLLSDGDVTPDNAMPFLEALRTVKPNGEELKKRLIEIEDKIAKFNI